MAIDISLLTIEKAFLMALKSEIDTAETYEKLQKMINNFVLKDKLKFLVEEEKKHQKIIKELFRKMFSGKEPSSTEKSLLPRLTLALQEDTSVPDLLELAMEAEKIAEEFYDNLSQEIEERGVQDILQYLVAMEHSHYFLLKGEYELCSRDEMYFDRDDFQYDMVHIGP
jgi:rubrerythrin